MPDYDFRALSTFDFETLTRDLLQEELKVRLESFAKGRDGGIDFRFQSAKDEIVVQCKHYANYDDLQKVLSQKERSKVKNLKPKRYILSVSTPLTPHRKEQLLSLFRPYCLGTQDIYGREDINNLLGKFPLIERKNFKLWLTSETVLTRVIQAGIWGDAELTLERIRRRTSRYVPNSSLDRAKQILDEHHYCIIAGIPGIGKTTLAEILLIDYVDRHGYEAIRIANDLSEIKEVKHQEKRQIFYYDDFLGIKTLDKLEKNEDRRLIDLLDEVSKNNNWRFILTTREYILNAAKLRYESFAYPAIPLDPCIVELSDYTRPIRGKILYNHIFFSDLADRYKRALLEHQRYENILSHENYNPRIIEHMTLARNAEVVNASKYYDEFIANLENPTRIWDHAFKNQLDEAARHLLLTLGSLPSETLVADLEVAFNAFYQYRRQKIGFAVSSRDYENALKELDGNFIKTSMVGRDQIVTFHNPSVDDYIASYLNRSPQVVLDLIESTTFFDQFEELWKGQHGERFEGVSINANAFVRRMAERFDAPASRMIRIGNEKRQIIGVTRRRISFEARVIFALEIDQTLNTVETKSVVRQLMDRLKTELNQCTGDKDDTVRLLKKLYPDANAIANAPVIVAAANYLAKDLDTLHDFSSLRRFVEAFPKAYTDENLDELRRRFSEYCEDYDSSWYISFEELRTDADDLERIGRQLEVDVDKVCAKLIKQAEQLESEMIEEDYDEEPDDDWRERDTESDNIESMFEGLLAEIEDRSH